MTGSRQAALLLGCLLAPAALAAQEQTPQAPSGPPASCAASCAPPVVKTIRQQQINIVEEQCATTKPDLVLREVTTTHRKCDREIDWHEDVQCCTELELKPRQVEQQVTCMTVKTFKTVDPCTGCCKTECRQVPEVQTVTVTTYDLVPVTKQYKVRTPYLKPVDTVVQVKTLALDAITVPAIEKRLRAVPTTCELNVVVPPPCMAPPPCASPEVLPGPPLQPELPAGKGKSKPALPAAHDGDQP
jgi:hypothetical protein